jgi:hypothetical protein
VFRFLDKYPLAFESDRRPRPARSAWFRGVPVRIIRGWRAIGIRWGTTTSGTTDIGRALPTEALVGCARDTTEDSSTTGIGKASGDGWSTTTVGTAIAAIEIGANATVIEIATAIITDAQNRSLQKL